MGNKPCGGDIKNTPAADIGEEVIWVEDANTGLGEAEISHVEELKCKYGINIKKCGVCDGEKGNQHCLNCYGDGYFPDGDYDRMRYKQDLTLTHVENIHKGLQDMLHGRQIGTVRKWDEENEEWKDIHFISYDEKTNMVKYKNRRRDKEVKSAPYSIANFHYELRIEEENSIPSLNITETSEVEVSESEHGEPSENQSMSLPSLPSTPQSETPQSIRRQWTDRTEKESVSSSSDVPELEIITQLDPKETQRSTASVMIPLELDARPDFKPVLILEAKHAHTNQSTFSEPNVDEKNDEHSMSTTVQQVSPTESKPQFRRLCEMIAVC